MKIRRLNESAEFNFNSAASSGNWPYKMSIETYANIRDEISQIIDNLDQSSVFAIARDANKLGLSIDEERLYYSPDATIETNISPEKINQFRNIVMRYSHEQLNEESNRKFYIDEIVSAPGGKTETERHSFTTLDELKQYCKDAGLTKDDIANCGGCDVKDLCEDIEKLHTKPNGEYLVKADSGKGYTAFSRDNVAIGGIDNEDADSDDKAIDKFKRNEYSECLNEEYFDTAEYRIQKYEDDIPELMAGMHDDYMEGKLDAARYAEVLKKVYDALADCDYKYTMSAPVGLKVSGKRVLDALAKLDETLNEGSEKYYAAKYTAVDNSGNKTVKKICFRCDGTIEDAEKEVDALIKEPYMELKVIGSCLRGVAEKDGYKLIESVEYDEDNEDVEYDDDYSEDYTESLDECSGIKAHKVIMGEGIDDIGLDGDLGEEGPTGDKTEDIEFVMEEYIAESLLIDFVEKVDALTYKVGANDQVVTVVFDPKWSEYVYTIDGKGPYSHSSYEFISRDIYDFVMSQIDASELDDLDD